MVDLDDNQRGNVKGEAAMVDPDDAMNVNKRKSQLIPENLVQSFDSGMFWSSSSQQPGSSNL